MMKQAMKNGEKIISFLCDRIISWQLVYVDI